MRTRKHFFTSSRKGKSTRNRKHKKIVGAAASAAAMNEGSLSGDLLSLSIELSENIMSRIQAEPADIDTKQGHIDLSVIEIVNWYLSRRKFKDFKVLKEYQKEMIRKTMCVYVNITVERELANADDIKKANDESAKSKTKSACVAAARSTFTDDKQSEYHQRFFSGEEGQACLQVLFNLPKLPGVGFRPTVPNDKEPCVLGEVGKDLPLEFAHWNLAAFTCNAGPSEVTAMFLLDSDCFPLQILGKILRKDGLGTGVMTSIASNDKHDMNSRGEIGITTGFVCEMCAMVHQMSKDVLDEMGSGNLAHYKSDITRETRDMDESLKLALVRERLCIGSLKHALSTDVRIKRALASLVRLTQYPGNAVNKHVEACEEENALKISEMLTAILVKSTDVVSITTKLRSMLRNPPIENNRPRFRLGKHRVNPGRRDLLNAFVDRLIESTGGDTDESLFQYIYSRYTPRTIYFKGNVEDIHSQTSEFIAKLPSEDGAKPFAEEKEVLLSEITEELSKVREHLTYAQSAAVQSAASYSAQQQKLGKLTTQITDNTQRITLSGKEYARLLGLKEKQIETQEQIIAALQQQQSSKTGYGFIIGQNKGIPVSVRGYQQQNGVRVPLSGTEKRSRNKGLPENAPSEKRPFIGRNETSIYEFPP